MQNIYRSGYAVMAAAMLMAFSVLPAWADPYGKLSEGNHIRPAYRDDTGRLYSDWKEKCRADAVKTVRGTVISTLKGIVTPGDLAETVRLIRRDWDDWKDSKVFVLRNERDMDAYGNLLSFKALCRTLSLASELWNGKADSELSRLTLEKARWMESRSRQMCAAVESIIRMQGYSEYLPQQLDIMEEEYLKLDAVFGEFVPMLRYE